MDDLERTEKAHPVSGEKQRSMGDVEKRWGFAPRSRSLYELTDAISAKTGARVLAVLDAKSFPTGDGPRMRSGTLPVWPRPSGDAGNLERKKRARDQAALWRRCGRVPRPPFAAEDILRQAAATTSKRELTGAIQLIEKGSGSALKSPTKRLVLKKHSCLTGLRPKRIERVARGSAGVSI